jgi:hypothetical protein
MARAAGPHCVGFRRPVQAAAAPISAGTTRRVTKFSLGMGYSKFCFGVLSVLALPLGRVPSLLLLGLFAAPAMASTRGTQGYSLGVLEGTHSTVVGLQA